MNARRAALEAVRGWWSRSEPVRTGLDRRIGNVPARDHGLARELALGLVRHHGTLSRVVGAFADRPVRAIDEPLRPVLEMGVYQLLFLDVPDHAAVKETVDLVRGRGARGFCNGVLRAVARAIVERTDEPDGDPRRLVPVREGCGVRFDRPVLPDPEEDLAVHLARAHSQPVDTVRRWLDRWPVDRVRTILRAQNRIPPTFVRANLLRGDRDAVLAAYAEAGVDAVPVGPPSCVRLPSDHSVGEDPLHADGRVTVQDRTAQLVAPALEPGPDDRTLCACAAPGGKATHVAELAGDRGLCIAQDRDPARLRSVAGHVGRLGLSSVRCVAADSLRGPAVRGPVDAVLVDAPCSNSGVQRRRVEARWRLPSYEREGAGRLQIGLLQAARRALEGEGTIVYATCSIEASENGELVRRFLEVAGGEVELVMEDEVLPGDTDGDGGYRARLACGGVD